MKLSVETLKKIIVDSGYMSEKEFDQAAKHASDLNRDVKDVLIFRV